MIPTPQEIRVEATHWRDDYAFMAGAHYVRETALRLLAECRRVLEPFAEVADEYDDDDLRAARDLLPRLPPERECPALPGSYLGAGGRTFIPAAAEELECPTCKANSLNFVSAICDMPLQSADAPKADMRKEIVRLIIDEFDQPPAELHEEEWADKAESVADKILATLGGPAESQPQAALTPEADVERIARMIARGLGHNDDTGMHWEHYIAPARIIVRDMEARTRAEQGEQT